MVAKSYTFQESVDYLLSLGNEVSAMKLGLENIRRLLAALGDPQNNYLKVQIAGTNGKGSVCAFLNSICLEAGIKTGLYTSPHLVSITERVKINGIDIVDDDFARLASRVREAAEDLVARGELEYTATFFEQVTAIALLAFADAKVELAILETGLGGRLDATTAAKAEIAAITRIDYDHQQYLGETIEEIAAEKAAIIHAGSKVVIGKQRPDAMAVILHRCVELGIKPKTADKASIAWQRPSVDIGETMFHLDETRLGLLGDHQVENATVAVQVAEYLDESFNISSENVFLGLERARHPGRLEWLEHEGNAVLLDGAHNPGGARALSDYLGLTYPDSKITLVFGMMNDKDMAEIAELLFPRMENIIFTRPDNARAVDPLQLAASARGIVDASRVFVVDNVADALDSALQITSGYPATPYSFTCVTGSLYLVGEIKSLLSA
jgi:dihydrofolate synthase/folylpolyglutamate synthase